MSLKKSFAMFLDPSDPAKRLGIARGEIEMLATRRETCACGLMALIVACAGSGLIGGVWLSGRAFAEPAERGATETAALAQAQQEYDDAKTRLAAVGEELEMTRFQLEKTKSELAKLGIDIDATQQGIDEKTQELSEAQEALSAYLVINYKSSEMSFLDLLLSSSDFNDFVTRSFYATKIQNAQVDTIYDIKTIKAELESQERLLTEQQEQAAELKAQLEEQQSTLQAREEELDQILDGLSEEVRKLFEAQQAELAAAAAARGKARQAAERGQSIGAYTPGESMGSIVEDAYACLGIPYVWGGDDDNFAELGGYDCSGFVQHCYALEGYEIGRTTWDQIDQINALGNWRVNLDELQPGDLLFKNDGHVGIYIGGNQMIDAPSPGEFIRIDEITEYIGGGSPV